MFKFALSFIFFNTPNIPTLVHFSSNTKRLFCLCNLLYFKIWFHYPNKNRLLIYQYLFCVKIFSLLFVEIWHGVGISHDMSLYLSVGNVVGTRHVVSLRFMYVCLGYYGCYGIAPWPLLSAGIYPAYPVPGCFAYIRTFKICNVGCSCASTQKPQIGSICWGIAS